MKTKINAICANMLAESSRLANTYIKFESMSWGASDTLNYKARAQQSYQDAMTIAREFNIDIKPILPFNFLAADELPRSQYE